MNLSKREFLQVLGAGTMAGMGLAQHAQAQPSKAETACTTSRGSAPCRFCT
jgi:hypothetical protein